MSKYDEIVILLKKATNKTFEPVNAKAKQALMELNTPKEIFNYFCSIDPEDTEINGIRLFSAESFIAENIELMPGCYSAPFGYFAIAANEYGDAFCWNLNNNSLPAIVNISHESVFEDTTADDIEEIAEPIAENLYSFIEKVISDHLD